MTGLILPICFTLGVSGFCSLLEAFILSTTISEIEALKKESPKQGSLLETFKNDIELTSSAILTLNTIANTMGAMWVASVAKDVAGNLVGIISFFMVLGILILSEILPKNMGVIYRRVLQKRLVYPLQLVRYSMYPLAYLTMHSIRLVVDREAIEAETDEDEEITLLADKHAKDGSLTNSERDMIHNALSLDDVHISEIMTPRTVVTALDANLTVEEVFIQFRNIPFGRLPVYQESIDNIVGLVRRRDLLQAMAKDQNKKKVGELMGEMTFLPETSSAAAALQHFLRTHQQLAMVVDEFGSTVGVVAVEDTIEHILGREIYEETDVAVDMRELARDQAEKKKAEKHPISAPQ